MKCPHCGEPTGVVPDANLTAEEYAATIELARIEGDTYVQPSSHGTAADQELAVIGIAADAVVAVVSSAVEAVTGERDEEPSIPRAIAREHTGPRPIEPLPSPVEPEPAPPPADNPRFLK